jgi:tetratricopeptide (TPR) repeat protein
MNPHLAQISTTARNAASRHDWGTLDACAREFLKQDTTSPEGHFLYGLAMKAAQHPAEAIDAFARALALDNNRYDAAIELANQHCVVQRHADAARLVRRYEDVLGNSPLYLHLAGSVYSRIGLPEKAWPLYQRANALQPGIDLFQASLGTCAMFLGKVDEARKIYQELLRRRPTHQRNHYQLSQLETATDTTHIEQMQALLDSSELPPDRNIFLYYAIGKEFEDLERWEEAFRYFELGAEAVMSVARYDIDTDLAVIDRVIECCDADWLASGTAPTCRERWGKTPVFIVGLPRSGTTLTDRIVSSHSQVASVDETQYMPMVIRRLSGIVSEDKMNAAMIESAARADIGAIGDGYMEMLQHRLTDEPAFIDKLPFNVLYLGFVCKAFPDARIILMQRNPLDSCFAMYKQVFLGAYKFSYSLESLGRFYIAYSRLLDHWRRTLGDGLIELQYETLVSDQEQETRNLLARLGLDFEAACLAFDSNTSAIATASSAQVREKIHTRSVHRWKRYARQLQPLREQLEAAGIAIGDTSDAGRH